MIVKCSFILLFITCLLLSSNWFYEQNDPWQINTSSRSSSLGGVDIYNYSQLISKSPEYNHISIFNSNMFGDIIHYNNIYYKFDIDRRTILGSTLENIKIGCLNRTIDIIQNTTQVWDASMSNVPLLSDINYELIEYYQHRDVSLSILLPFSNKVGSFGLDIKPSFSKIDTYTSSSINLDFMYSKVISDNLAIMLSLENIFSYKKWSSDTVERFYPKLQLLLHFTNERINYFFQLDNFYLNYDFLSESYNIFNNIKMGLEYSMNDKLKYRIGFNEYYNTYGIGVPFNNFIFDYACLDHKDLNFSHQFTITYLIKKSLGDNYEN